MTIDPSLLPAAARKFGSAAAAFAAHERDALQAEQELLAALGGVDGHQAPPTGILANDGRIYLVGDLSRIDSEGEFDLTVSIPFIDGRTPPTPPAEAPAPAAKPAAKKKAEAYTRPPRRRG